MNTHEMFSKSKITYAFFFHLRNSFSIKEFICMFEPIDVLNYFIFVDVKTVVV